jgi:hypothetical protein
MKLRQTALLGKRREIKPLAVLLNVLAFPFCNIILGNTQDLETENKG